MAYGSGKWATMAIVGYSHSVNPRDENRAAHGGVCLLQTRRNSKGEILGRRVNSNGRHREVGEPFALDSDTLDNWNTISKAMR